MKTIVLPISTPELDHLRQMQSRVIRMSYRMAEENLGQTAVIRRLGGKVPAQLDGHLVRRGCRRGMDIYRSRKTGVCFGSHHQFRRRARGLIRHEEWKRCRLQPLLRIGQANQKGNRRFRLDMERRKLTYTDRDNRFEWTVPQMARNYEAVLKELSQKSLNREIPLTYSVGDRGVAIQFDETRLDHYRWKYRRHTAIRGRTLGLDLNPNRIGLVVRDAYGAILLVEQYEFETTKQTKRQNGIRLLADHIYEILHHYRCERLALEDLSRIPQATGRGRRLNGLLNRWIRHQLQSKLERICRITGVKLCSINAAYSSFIGRLMYPRLGDCCGAAVEIARRRGYQKNQFYPRLITTEDLVHRWKEMAGFEYRSWVGLYAEIHKIRRLGWRSPPACSRSSRFGSPRSGITRLVVQPVWC